MRRLFKIFSALISQSSKAYMEHRWNTLGNALNGLVSLLITILLVDVIFSLTNQLHGWTRSEVLFLVGIYQVISFLFSALFLKNISSLPDYIEKGKLDYFLTKPINAQFLVSLRYIRVHHFISALTGIILIFYAVDNMNKIFGLTDWFFLIIGATAGLLIFYSIYFLIALLSFWFVRFSALADVYHVISRPLSLPVDIFGRYASFILTFVIPLAFVVTVPVEIFLNKSPIFFIVLEMLIAAVLLIVSKLAWNFALRYYTSASS